MSTRTFSLPRRWPRLLFCLVWYLVLSGLLSGRRYALFLRPEFGWLLAFAAVAVAVFGLVSFGDRKGRVDTAGLVRLGILLLPLAFLLQARGTSLGNQAFLNRCVGPAASSVPFQSSSRTQRDTDGLADTDVARVPATEPGPAQTAGSAAAASEEAPDEDPASALETNLRREGDSPTVSILDLQWGPQLYKGRRVHLVGRLHRDERLTAFGTNVVLVYRFVITCCAADALPVTVLVDCNVASEQTDGDWVTVDGIVAIREYEGQNMLFIEDGGVTAAEEPAQPYLY